MLVVVSVLLIPMYLLSTLTAAVQVDESKTQAAQNITAIISQVLQLNQTTADPSKPNSDIGCWRRVQDRGRKRLATYCPKGQERSGMLCYPVCRNGFKSSGPICWSLKNGTYGRGLGRPMQCPPDYTQHLGVCFPTCPKSFTSSLAHCKQKCPERFPVQCGSVCFKHPKQCSNKFYQTSKSILKFLASLVNIGAKASQVAASANPADPASIVQDSFQLTGAFGQSIDAGLNDADRLVLKDLPLCPVPRESFVA